MELLLLLLLLYLVTCIPFIWSVDGRNICSFFFFVTCESEMESGVEYFLLFVSPRCSVFLSDSHLILAFSIITNDNYNVQRRFNQHLSSLSTIYFNGCFFLFLFCSICRQKKVMLNSKCQFTIYMCLNTCRLECSCPPHPNDDSNLIHHMA